MLKFVSIFKLYLYEVWHTSKDVIYFERKYLISSYWNVVGVCVFPIFVQGITIKPLTILTLLLSQSLITKTLLNMFMPSIFIRLTTTTTNPCVSIHFLLSDRLTINSCTGSVWWKYLDPYNQLTWDYFPGQLCFHETMPCTNREKATVMGIRLNYIQSEWLNSTLH